MLQTDVYYRHHFPVLQTDVYYRHHFPVLQSDVYYRHHFPVLQTDVYYIHTFPCCRQTCTTYTLSRVADRRVLQTPLPCVADRRVLHTHFPVLQTDVYYRHHFLCCKQTMYSFSVLLVTALAVVGVRGHAGHHGSDNVMQMNQQPPSSFHDPSVVGNQE